MSKEMNGSKKFKEYDKLEGKGADCALTGLRESVKYGSLKEACMLDEGYFVEDSYVKETAAEKTAKLTEQVALLVAREKADPLYDELLKESAYCMRLREQIQAKYKRDAAAKVETITEAAVRKYTTKDGIEREYRYYTDSKGNRRVDVTDSKTTHHPNSGTNKKTRDGGTRPSDPKDGSEMRDLTYNKDGSVTMKTTQRTTSHPNSGKSNRNY